MANSRTPQLLEGWVASVPRADTARLAEILHFPNIQVCESGDQLIWLQGKELTDELRLALHRLLDCSVYQQLDDGQLVPERATLPHGYFPQGAWRPLKKWLTPSLPTTRFTARCESPIPITLCRSSRSESPGLLLTAWATWHSYASTAPRIRLERLRFAASSEHAIVVGTPLPPLTGDFFYLQEGIAVPVGYDWQPRLDAAVLRRKLHLESGDIALLLRDGSCSVITDSQFHGASRSAVRLTAGANDAEP